MARERRLLGKKTGGRRAQEYESVELKLGPKNSAEVRWKNLPVGEGGV